MCASSRLNKHELKAIYSSFNANNLQSYLDTILNLSQNQIHDLTSYPCCGAVEYWTNVREAVVAGSCVAALCMCVCV